MKKLEHCHLDTGIAMTQPCVLLRGGFDTLERSAIKQLDLTEIEDDDEVLSPDPNASASFSSRSMYVCSLSDEALTSLIHSSTNLGRIRVTDFELPQPAWFGNALLCHRSTLTTVDIRGPMDGTQDTFDATRFPNLASHSLSIWRRPLSWEPDDVKVLGPRLKQLALDFHPFESRFADIGESAKWRDFGPSGTNWLFQFTNQVQRLESALERIHFKFDPKDDGRDEPNPWEHYEEINTYYPFSPTGLGR
ncbi:hypothetical protein BU23DRAFT_601476 [Bimuria novae-zelandiae CBS 107.79]|uniref:Uncharacterized protein n=1 Tax=Bimuria novae-zelandiae CBS 107.79 TaxID=1447943 RepID=A0A6A5V0F7_9PLEO|nr:hypothetical protein BU23DRAFT_601476 [Bimuria novae-zelandiae CBS 107.79]